MTSKLKFKDINNPKWPTWETDYGIITKVGMYKIYHKDGTPHEFYNREYPMNEVYMTQIKRNKEEENDL